MRLVQSGWTQGRSLRLRDSEYSGSGQQSDVQSPARALRERRRCKPSFDATASCALVLAYERVGPAGHVHSFDFKIHPRSIWQYLLSITHRSGSSRDQVAIDRKTQVARRSPAAGNGCARGLAHVCVAGSADWICGVARACNLGMRPSGKRAQPSSNCRRRWRSRARGSLIPTAAVALRANSSTELPFCNIGRLFTIKAAHCHCADIDFAESGEPDTS